MKSQPKSTQTEEIIDKKLENNVVVYQVKKGNQTKWMSFEDIKDKIQLISQFEERLKVHQKRLEKRKPGMEIKLVKETLMEKIQRLRKGGKNKEKEMEVEQQKQEIESDVKEQLKEKKIKKQKGKQKKKEEKEQQKKESESESESQKVKGEIENIIFLSKGREQLLFQVIFKGGTEKIMTNSELKQLYPDHLIRFYENNVMVSPQ